ncbi:MAG: GlsB/YeaQ/YmgE family stress response membrane protein [Chloroflexota bacterium]|nr:GlsB/YeaQ/YmgE family stress response membrane protein [Chloroflexota bacterium]
MSIIAWIVLGLIAGWLAGTLMKGSGYGIVGDIVLGILGAIVGGWLTGVLLGRDLMTGFNIESLIVAVIGAVVLIAISRLFTGRRASNRV